MEKLSKSDEQLVLAALESSIGLVNGGLGANEALAKKAEENGFGAELAKRMVEAYNVSKTLAHYKHAAAEKRGENFPLADAQEVLKLLYAPRAVKTAAAPVRLLFGERENFNVKAAANVPLPALRSMPLDRDPDVEFNAWTRERDRLQLVESEARQAHAELGLKMAGALGRAVHHFKLATHTPFQEVEKRAAAEYGDLGRRCMDMIHRAGNLAEARWTKTASARLVLDRSKEPYGDIANLVAWAKAAAMQAQKEAAASCSLKAHMAKKPYKGKKTASLLSEALSSPFPVEGPTGSREGLRNALLEKQAVVSLFMPLNEMFWGGVKDPAKESPTSMLDPQHEAGLKSIKVRGMLNDLMSNDEVISQYPREQVLDGYNKIIEVAPEAGSRSLVMRGLLRRHLQQGGVMEPHEVKALAETEQKIVAPYSFSGGDNVGKKGD